MDESRNGSKPVKNTCITSTSCTSCTVWNSCRLCEKSDAYLTVRIFAKFWAVLSDQKPTDRKKIALSEPFCGSTKSFHTVCLNSAQQKNGPRADQLSLGNSVSRSVAFAPLRNFLARCDQKTMF